jgi:phosphoribosylaminoimidazole-succinocarboxamide synthase
MRAADFDRAAELAAKLFEAGQAHCRERGLILVDTKYELGKTPDGEIVVIDEIHTPDSSRFWLEKTYEERFESGRDPESFDKDYVRRYLREQGFSGDGSPPAIPGDVRVEASLRYRAAVEWITGEVFEPNLDDPIPRLSKNLGLSD